MFHKPSLGSYEVPDKIFGPIGSAVLSFWTQEDSHPNRQTDNVYL